MRKLVAGDSYSWLDDATTDNLGNAIMPGDYSLLYCLRGPVILDLVATTQGNQWLTTITATQSATLPAGDVYWQAFATKGSNRITLGSGKFVVSANLQTASINYDGRSQIKKDLEAVQAAMRAIIAGGAVQKYAIGTRQLEKMQMSSLIELESRLKYQLSLEEKAQKMANGDGNPHSMYVRFRR